MREGDRGKLSEGGRGGEKEVRERGGVNEVRVGERGEMK